jgi:peptide/nickel transport system substrate-binding protein
MFVKRTSFYVLSLLVVLTTVLAACTPPAAPPPTEAPAEATDAPAEATEAPAEATEAPAEATEVPAAPEAQGTLTIALTTNVTALEQAYAPERQASNASWSMFDSLVFAEPDGTYSPALAESWEVSDDDTTYTFHLRQDVTFHNGQPFTADDVVFSWETYRQPEVTYANNWTIAESVEKVDDYTVTVSTAEPNALLLPYIGFAWAISPANYGGLTAAEFAEAPIGTGPFMFEEWDKSDHLTVVANPNYWREGYPKVERVIFKFLPESATRVAAIQTGEIDIAPRLSSEEADSLAGVEGVEIVTYLGTRIFYLAFNNLTTGIGTPIENVEVRKALAHAIDVSAIIDSLFGGNGAQAVGLVGQGELGFDNADPVPYDPELAMQMLASAGYPDGFSIGMACPDQGYTHINEVCQAIQGYFADVGVETELDIMESTAYWDLEATQQLPPLFVDGWSVTFPEGHVRLQGTVGEGETYAAWYDERMDSLVKEIAVTVDVEERADLYGEIQQLMRDEQPLIYLYQISAFEAVRDRVQGYEPRPAENYFLWEVSVSGE